MRTSLPFLLVVLIAAPASQCAAQRSLHKWDFVRGPGEWLAVHSVEPLTVKDGLLVVLNDGADPFIHSSRRRELAIDGNSAQFIRLVARSNVTGSAEFFWCAEAPGKPADFVAGQEVHFTIRGDGVFHTYHVFPGWKGQITRLRFDPPDGEAGKACVEIRSIEILELPPSPRSEGPVWKFHGTLAGFVPTRDVESFQLADDGVVLKGLGSEPTLSIMDLSLEAEKLPWLTLDAVSASRTVLTVRWTDELGRSQSFAHAAIPIVPGKSRYALRLQGRRGWEGTVSGLELSWRADDQPVELRFTKAELAGRPVGPAAAELVSFGFDRAVAFLGEEVQLTAKVRNAGGETLPYASLEVLAPGSARSQSASISPLAPGGEATLRIPWTAFALGELNCRVSLSPSGDAGTARIFVAHRPSDASIERGVRVGDGQAVLATEALRLRAPAISGGHYGPLFLDVRGAQGWRQVATLPAIGSLADRADACQEWATGEAREIGDGTPGLCFERRTADASGRKWCAAAVYRPSEDPSRIDVRHTLTAEAPGEVFHFGGPRLRVGDRSFGAAKWEALFPGLEYLNADESSSSDRDIAPPGDLRAVPHPHRICIPLMAVASPQRDLVALLWDHEQRWWKDRDQPSAVFASPNLVEGGDARFSSSAGSAMGSSSNHLLGLFLPSVPEYVSENHLQASHPLRLQAGESLSLESSLYVKPQGQVVDAVVAWYRHFKPKRAGAPPLPVREHYALALRALEEILLTEGKGWASVKEWAPSRDTRTAQVYWYLADELQRPALRDVASMRVKDVHALPLSLLRGGVAASVQGVRAAGLHGLSRREPDGNWVFRPDDRTASLGQRGDTNVGMAAGPVRSILQAAAQSADRQLLEAGLAGLAWMRKWRIPRGSQVWEIPLHAPDILASAHASQAFLWGYRLTGDASYLEDSIYWAKTGLPFIYAWQADDKGLEPMRGGSIPIFGATFYTGSWFGTLVQWCGLEYAKALLELAQFDPSFDWKAIAGDIITSAWRQQQSKPGFQGLYPDSWSMLNGNISWGLMLGPQNLVRYQLQLDGRVPDGDLLLLRQSNCLVSVLAPGALSEAAVGERRGGHVVMDAGASAFDLRFTHSLDLDVSPHLAIVGVDVPAMVQVDQNPLPRTDSMTSVAAGWMYEPNMPGIVLKLTPAKRRQVEVSIGGLRVVPRQGE